MGAAVAVLNPQDSLIQAFFPKPLSSPPPKPKRNPNPNRLNHSRSNRKPRRSTAALEATVEKPVNNMVNGSVKILKRGDVLREVSPDPPSPMGILGPVPKSAGPRPYRVDGFYAGSSACIVSPPPSSVPLPAFFAKKVVSATNSEATNALLKMLHLDLE